MLRTSHTMDSYQNKLPNEKQKMKPGCFISKSLYNKHFATPMPMGEFTSYFEQPEWEKAHTKSLHQRIPDISIKESQKKITMLPNHPNYVDPETIPPKPVWERYLVARNFQHQSHLDDYYLNEDYRRHGEVSGITDQYDARASKSRRPRQPKMDGREDKNNNEYVKFPKITQW